MQKFLQVEALQSLDCLLQQIILTSTRIACSITRQHFVYEITPTGLRKVDNTWLFSLSTRDSCL